MSLAIAPNLIPLGYANYETLSSALALTATPTSGSSLTTIKAIAGVPGQGIYATITFEAQDVRITFDGTTPTAAVGQLIKADTLMSLDNSRDLLGGLKVIEVSAGAKMSINYFRGPGG
jgi:hypothetical protein